jgi:hypothetical protein
MGAKGNKFWEIRSTHGRKPIFETSEDLWRASCEYFEWANDTPLKEDKLFAFQGEVTRDTIDLMRPFTISSLCIFLDISDQTLADYGKRDGFIGVVDNIKKIIYEQKFSGAATGLLNSNIIARDLGLKDKSELTGEDGGPIQTATTFNFVPVNSKT